MLVPFHRLYSTYVCQHANESANIPTITFVLDKPERTQTAGSLVDSLAWGVLQVVQDCTVTGSVEDDRPDLVHLDSLVGRARAFQVAGPLPSCK
jgi:hypothetical protein